MIKLVDNPKQEGKWSWSRFERYQSATTLREIIELSISSSDPATRARQIEKAHKDIVFDSLRGYILYPQHEHNASTHFVDAGRLARKLGTVNIHALYSSSEMDSARASMIAEATDIHSTSFAARLAEATAREARSVPLRFHDQLISMWEYDLALHLNDGDVCNE